jgi:hypothetical protein
VRRIVGGRFTRGKCRPVSAWRVAGWRMGVDGSLWESRDRTKGMISTSDYGEYVTYGKLCREEGVIDRWEWPIGRIGEVDTDKSYSRYRSWMLYCSCPMLLVVLLLIVSFTPYH